MLLDLALSGIPGCLCCIFTALCVLFCWTRCQRMEGDYCSTKTRNDDNGPQWERGNVEIHEKAAGESMTTAGFVHNLIVEKCHP